MAFTITNTSDTVVYNFSNYILYPGASISVDHLDSEIVNAVDQESDLTIDPPYTTSYSTPYSATFVYTGTGVNVSGLSAYPDLTDGAINATLARAVTLTAKNLEALKSSVVTLQGVLGELQQQVNNICERINAYNL